MPIITARDIMDEPRICVPSDCLKAASALLHDGMQKDALVVVDSYENKKIVGLLERRDFIKITEYGLSIDPLASDGVKAIMTKESDLLVVASCLSIENIRLALINQSWKNKRYILVCYNGQVLGIISHENYLLSLFKLVSPEPLLS